MKNRLDVLVLSSWYPNRKDSLDGNFVQNHVKAISLYHNLKVVYATSFPTEGNYEIEEVKNENYSETIVYFPYHKYKIIRLFRKIKAYNIGIKSIGAYDIIHANVFFYIGIYASILAFFKSKKLIVTEHSSQFQHISLVHKFIFKACSPFVDVFIPVSSFLTSKLIELGVSKNKIQVIFNTIPVDKFAIKKKEGSSKFRFLHISRFDREIKNVRGILNAAKMLYNETSNFQLEIIGDGDMEFLYKMVAEVGISKDSLVLTGIISNENMPIYYNNSDCFILFSHFENNPLVLIESLCSGVPVIATRVGGIPDFINKNNGILIEDNDEIALYNAMKYMLENSNLYHSESIRAYIVDRVSMSGVGLEYDKIYKTITVS